MRCILLLSLSSLILAAPPVAPTITQLVFSGSGCPHDSGSVKSDTSILGDTAGVSFTTLVGNTTDNCEVHIQSSGGSPGWQVAVSQITYEGDVYLKGNSQLDTYTDIFWSNDAANTGVLTGGITCTGTEIKEFVTVKSSTSDLKWSKCTGSDGNPGILNVGFRPVVQGDYGSYNFEHAWWQLVWRQC